MATAGSARSPPPSSLALPSTGDRGRRPGRTRHRRSGFFVMLADTPHLDGQYPFVGRVIEGLGSVDRIMVGDTIVRATVE
ncbi:MAG: peptidylprolyl isomerase [Polyangiales bacterium]